jgi:sirohydrochlorin cobaltochelatase
MSPSKTAVLIIAHGSPALDTPIELRREYRKLRAQVDKSDRERTREQDLEAQIRRWPRTGDNDPYQQGTEALTAQLQAALGQTPVVAAYNEFCSPSVEEALGHLRQRGVNRVEVLSTMVTPGGGHSERDIPAALEACRRKFPNLQLVYRWPYDLRLVAQLLKDHLQSDAPPS